MTEQALGSFTFRCCEPRVGDFDESVGQSFAGQWSGTRWTVHRSLPVASTQPPGATPVAPRLVDEMVYQDMSQERWGWLLNTKIPSERGAGQRIIEQVLGQLQEHDWDSHDIFSVRLALEEAIVNAIKHGNRLDPRKQVHVQCKMSCDKLWIQITDEGPGFDPEAVPDPTDPANLEKPSGRGIMLMKNYMNDVEYNERGNVVTMEKRRAGCS